MCAKLLDSIGFVSNFDPETLPNQVDLFLMSQMQGIVFANNTNSHGKNSLLFIKIFQRGLEKLRKMKYNTFSYGKHIIKPNNMKYIF